MIKIKTLDLRSLRNKEHFQFSTEFKVLVEKYNPETLKIKSLFEVYCKQYADEDEAVLVVRKSAISQNILDVDMRRNNDFRGLSETIRAAQKHFNPEVVSAARRIKILFDTVGNVVSMPKDQETATIYNLIQELQGTYKADIQLLRLEDWILRLEEGNKAFENLIRERVEETSKRTLLRVKETRIAVDEAYKKIIARIEAYINLDEDKAYKFFIPELNIIIDGYRNRLAQRQGIVESKKNKEQTPPEEEEK